MPVTVLGGAGFIGSNLVLELLDQKHEVTVLDNFSEGRMENLPKNHPRLEIVRGDIREYETVRRVVDRRDWVFALAAMSRIQPSITNPILAASQNVMGMANVLEACRQGGVKRVVYSASSSAYGRVNTPPLEEGMPTQCLNPYSLSKKYGEDWCNLYRDLYGLSTVSLRYFNVYGPRHQEEGDYATVVAIFMRQLRHGKPMTIVGDGSKRRDFTFVADVVRANIMAAMNYEATGLINIGTGTNYSIATVAKMVADTCGKTDFRVEHIQDRPAEAFETLADVRRAADVLGWKPSVSFTDGLRITHEFQKQSSLIVIP